MATTVRNASGRSSRSSLKGRKVLHPVQQPIQRDQVNTALDEKKPDALIKEEDNEKKKADRKSDVIEVMGKENSLLRSIDSGVTDEAAPKLQKSQLRSKVSKPKKKSAGKKAKKPKGSSSQSKTNFQSAEPSSPEVTPGYEFLTEDLTPEEYALSEEALLWKELAEQHEMSLQFALYENGKLREELTALEKENTTLLSILEYGTHLLDSLEESGEISEASNTE